MTTTDYIAGIATGGTLGLIIFVGPLRLINRWERRLAAKQAQALEAAIEAERRCALVAEDPTGIDDVVAELMAKPELEPADHIVGDTLVLVGPGFVHMRCRNARRDAGIPCPDCAQILAVKR